MCLINKIETKNINGNWEARSEEFPTAVGYGDTEKGSVENLVKGIIVTLIDTDLNTPPPKPV